MAVRVANLKKFRAGLSELCRRLVAGEWRSVSETVKNFRLRNFQAIRDQSDAVARWRLIARPGVDGQVVMVTPGGKEQRAWVDRKSTRLNSSHTVISYAVFCLKKKSGD